MISARSSAISVSMSFFISKSEKGTKQTFFFQLTHPDAWKHVPECCWHYYSSTDPPSVPFGLNAWKWSEESTFHQLQHSSKFCQKLRDTHVRWGCTNVHSSWAKNRQVLLCQLILQALFFFQSNSLVRKNCWTNSACNMQEHQDWSYIGNPTTPHHFAVQANNSAFALPCWWPNVWFSSQIHSQTQALTRNCYKIEQQVNFH